MATSVCVCSDYFTVGDDGELCLIPGSMGLRQTLQFKDPGTFSFEKADYPWLSRIVVRVQGAGGGSAGANAAADQAIVRPGGAGGGYSERLIQVASLGASESIVVGAPGAAGSGNSAGGAGGSSSFGGTVTAQGGGGGPAAQGSGTGTDAVQGPSGPTAGNGSWAQGGGGGGGGIRLNGTNGLSGVGGESHMGHGGVARSQEGAGTSPRGYGGGAGGALSYGGAYDGGDGGGGLVLIDLFG
ncbi:hypothetical protein [Streptomyces sp. NPDC047070]|uniref:glycine-rich domain-containing protein n=1 Tax=Streptomyces sp. NPDC047070 TaxID=3154923 RepID=UPI0034516657